MKNPTYAKLTVDFGGCCLAESRPKYGLYLEANLQRWGKNAVAISHHWNIQHAKAAQQFEEFERGKGTTEIIEFVYET